MAVLLSVTVVVGVALGVGWQWADEKAEAPEVAPATVTTDEPADVALATPVLSVRRAPAILSRSLNHEAFALALQPLLNGVGETSCVAVSVDGVPVVAKNEALAVVPASNMKLIVAAVALELLGEEHRFTTSVMGEVDAAGAVNGNLYLVGGGDPVLSTDWWVSSTTMPHPVINSTRLEELALAVIAKGVRQVTGSVVGDATRYDDENFPPSWEESLRVTEGGPYDALLVSDARTSVSTVADEPAAGAADVFTDLLESNGVRITGEPVAGRSTVATELATIESKPLPEILEEMLTTSDNNTAEMMVKEIGFAARGDGSREAGLDVIVETLEEWGVPIDGVELADGSGLSNNNRVTCATLLGVLQHGAVDDAVAEGLPVAATTGTLKTYFVGTPVEGKLQAKTGSRDNVDNSTPTSNPPGIRALSGYVPVSGGGAIEFALVLNSQTIGNRSEYEPIWYQMLAPAFGSYPSAASTIQLAPR